MTKRHPLMPGDTPDYMAAAWAGCIRYAAGNQEIISEFCRGTERTAYDPCEKSCVEAFIRWVNVHFWGPVDGVQQEEVVG